MNESFNRLTYEKAFVSSLYYESLSDKKSAWEKIVTSDVQESDIQNLELRQTYAALIECLQNSGNSAAIDIDLFNVTHYADESVRANVTKTILSFDDFISYNQEYTKVIKDFSLKAKLELALRKRLADLNQTSADEVITTIIQDILDFKTNHKENKTQSLSDIVKDISTDIQNPKSRNDLVFVGITPIDELIQGFRRGQLVVVAGRPSMGKSSLALQMASHGVAGQLDIVFSYEMTKKELGEREFGRMAGVDSSKFKTNDFDMYDLKRLSSAVSKLKDSTLLINDDPTMDLAKIRRELLYLSSHNKLRSVTIDYLQLMPLLGPRNLSKNDLIGEITKNLKKMAKEFNVVIFLVSQLNRGADIREDKRPVLADLRDSGAIEQDADTVLLIYRHAYYERKDKDETTGPSGGNETEIIVAKNRGGETGVARVRFIGKTTSFTAMV